MEIEGQVEDRTIKSLVQLAHDSLNRIKKISRERSGESDNPLGFLGLTLLFCSMLQGLALQEGADMTQAPYLNLRRK